MQAAASTCRWRFGQHSDGLSTLQVTTAEYEQLLTQGFQPTNPYLQTPQETPTQSFPQHGLHMLPSQMSAPEPSYSLEQPMYPSQISRHMSQAVSLSMCRRWRICSTNPLACAATTCRLATSLDGHSRVDEPLSNGP